MNLSIRDRLEKIEDSIEAACSRAGRKRDEVLLMAVTKTHPVTTVEDAWKTGLRHYGENRINEAVLKIEAFGFDAQWDLIGHLQSNKARLAVKHFDRIQSVDSEKLIRKISGIVREMGRESYPILLQVNAGEDPAKHGCAPEDAEKLLELAQEVENLTIDGLMTIAPLDQDLDVARRCFAHLRVIRDKLAICSGLPLKALSMGMSGDYRIAIEEGSTLVRVGSAIFGSR